jgi:hypothetical protein
MKIAYEVGPEKIAVGGIEFFSGIPKEVPDEAAERILAKKIIIFKKIVETAKDEG